MTDEANRHEYANIRGVAYLLRLRQTALLAQVWEEAIRDKRKGNTYDHCNDSQKRLVECLKYTLLTAVRGGRQAILDAASPVVQASPPTGAR